MNNKNKKTFKINMEPKNRCLEDDVRFQLDDY